MNLMETADLLLVERSGPLAVLTLNHPEKRNPLSRAMLTRLRDALGSLAEDRAVRVVILRAEGRVFSSGHDLRELDGCTADEAAEIFALCTEVMEAVRLLPQPVIAQVQGLATAAGCQLAATCDLIVAAEEAAFAAPGVKIGLFCTTPAVALSRAVPTKQAFEMLVTGEPLSARDAERFGMVNRVVPAERLAEETRRLAEKIAASSAATLAIGKRAFYEQLALDRPTAYVLAQNCMTENLRHGDAREGIRAFLEKRPPVWQS
jgi:enoyl-CoA hydratase/carnithine racemase